MPDLVAFGPFFIYNLFQNNLEISNISSIPEYVFTGYNFTHSIVIFFVITGVFYYITRNIPLITGGWLIHILIDITTHTHEFFPTPFLWPLTNFNLNGISWADYRFMIVNYSLLGIVYLYLFAIRKKKLKLI